jgi:phospholipase C
MTRVLTWVCLLGASFSVACGGSNGSAPKVTFTANPIAINLGQDSTLTWSSTNSASASINQGVGTVQTSGSMTVSPSLSTTYTITVTGPGGTSKAEASVVINPTPAPPPPTLTGINHVILMLQENRTFDTCFGMLNPYRRANGWNIGDDGTTYDVDGIDDKLSQFSSPDDEGTQFQLFKLATTCVDDMTSDWIGSYGDVNRYNFSPTRPITMDGFVHIAENYAKGGFGNGNFTDLTGQRAMGYYDQSFLNYYYFIASQFAISDRWFSPISSKSVPNRIATYTGGTTQGLVRDPANDDHFAQMPIETIFEELSNAGVSWKIYYGTTDDNCVAGDETCNTSAPNKFPATTFTYFPYSNNFLYANPGTCISPAVGSSAVGDASNSFCIDTTHIAPMSQFITDMQNGSLPAFAYIEPGFGHTDEHPGSGQSILSGQSAVANILNQLMASPSWKDSVFFLSYDEGGGPFDHVPSVPSHTNDFTDPSLGVTTNISSIAVNPDQYFPCLADGSTHCDLISTDPGANPADAPAMEGFSAQLGFRVPNLIVSPFSRRHYVSHTPIDHTAIIKFVESRFIGPNAHLTNRDAAQPDLGEFFDLQNMPWATPPTPPAPVTPASLGYNPCNPQAMQ